VKLRNRILFIVALTLACVIAILYFFAKIVLLGNLVKLEEDYVRRDVQRALSALNNDLSDLSRFAWDWAAWDDTCSFIDAPDNDYIRSNLVDSTFTGNHISLMLFLNNSGRLVYGKCYDLNGNREVPIPQSLLKQLVPGNLLLRHPTTSSIVKGILVLPQGPLLVVSHPVLTSSSQGPVRGSLIVGRFLDSHVIDQLAGTTRLSLALKRIGDSSIPSALQSLPDSTGGSRILVRPLDASTIAGYALLKDIYGKPALALQVSMPRVIYREARVGFFYLIAAFLLFGLVLLLYLEKVVISRIAALSTCINRIGTAGDLSGRVTVAGRDELGSLAREINRMLERLGQYHRRLLESEEQYRQLFNEALTGNYVSTPDGKILLCNKAFARIFGFASPEEAISSDPVLLFSREKDRAKYLDLITERRKLDFHEFELLRRNGERITVVMNAVGVFSENGELTQIRGYLFDTTEIKRVQEQLRQTATQLQAIFQALPDLYFRFDAEGTILDVKAGRVADLYLPPEKLIGRKIQDISLPSIGKQFLQAIEMVQETRSLVVIEYSILLKRGEQFFEARFLPLLENQIIAVVRNITEHKLADKQLRYLSLHDPLTGLYNRTFFDEELRRLEEGRLSLGLILCDVDGLKLVNDTMGHKAGDALLVAAAGVLKESFRQGDIVAKLGGDEFAVLLTDVSEYSMDNACNRIRQAVARYNAGAPRIPLSISVGWALRNDKSKTGADLFKEADTNMYREKLQNSDNARSVIVQTLMKILEEGGIIAAEQTERLSELMADFAPAAGLSERQMELRLLAQFHDIGNIAVPERILLKRGRLTPEEQAEMRLHCEMGHRIAQSVPVLFPIADWILKHHEWWNGQGYPLGIAGEEIPLECRLLAIAEAYLAMTSNRPYRKGMPHEEAVAELKRCTGTQFDPVLVERFISLFPTL